MINQPQYGEEYPPLGAQSQGRGIPLHASHLMMPAAQFGSQPQGTNLPQTQTPNYRPNGGHRVPVPNFHQHSFMSHYPRPAYPQQGPPAMLPPHHPPSHPHYGNAPPPPPPYMMQPPMHHYESVQPSLPPPFVAPKQPPTRPPQAPTKNIITVVKQQGKNNNIQKQKKKTSRDASPISSGQPQTVLMPGPKIKTFLNIEKTLLTEMEKAAEAVAAMFPQLSEDIQSMLLRLVLEDSILARNEMVVRHNVLDHSVVLQALHDISSQPNSSPTLCSQKLIDLKEAYLDGKPFSPVRLHVVSFRSGAVYRDYPCLAQKSEKEIASVAQELAMMLPAALKPLPLESLLALRERKPKEGWIEIDTAAANASQSKVKHAKLVEAPVVLYDFATTSAARDLATACLQKLDTACALVSDGESDEISGGLSELYIYGQADFGVQTIINSITDNIVDTRSTSTTTLPSDLLNAMLTTGSTSKSKNIGGADADGAAQQGGGVANALEFRHLTLERSLSYDSNTTSTDQVEFKNNSIFLLGGFVAPQLPSTFTTIDSARLFWSDRENSVIQLNHGQQHSLTIALCRLNSPERRGECGILQQVMVLFVAVGEGTEAYNELARIQNASFVDVYRNYGRKEENTRNATMKKEKAMKLISASNDDELGMEEIEIDAGDGVSGGGGGCDSQNHRNRSNIVTEGQIKGTFPVSTLGTPQSYTEQPLFRIFACARRVSVALLDGTQLTATKELRVDAKPFIPPRWKNIFDTQPAVCYANFLANTKELLVVDAEDDRALVSAASKKVWATRTHLNRRKSKTLVDDVDSGVGDNGQKINSSTDVEFKFEHPVLRRYHRLLHLEELAKEQDICRHDIFNAHMKLAVFAHSNQRKFTEVNLTSGNHVDGTTPTPTAAAPNKISKGVYRGPSISSIFPSPLFRKSEITHEYHPGSDDAVYVLGMLRHPGLSEGRPSLVIGDAVHVRPVLNDDVECICLVASIDGDIVYLVMPENFWKFSSLEKSLKDCAAKLPAGGGTSKTAALLENVPKNAFNGRVHVRFSFDRRPFMHMQNALRVADQKSSRISSNNTRTPPAMCFIPLMDSEINTPATNDIHKSSYSLQPTVSKVEEISNSSLELLCGRSGAPLNTEQRHAVSALILGGGRASPYALHGPPGTGKTVTMVSAALQLLSTYPEARLLLCAPQNYSADLLCSALSTAGLSESQLLRLNDPRRPPYSAKEDTMDFTFFNAESGLFELPQSLQQLQEFSVVVSTCTAAALLYPFYIDSSNSGGGELNRGFTHVLIDESGQALLPEALIPLALLSPPKSTGYNKNKNIDWENPGWGALLCGDPQQLGPTVHSLAASASGLSSSLLERLISAHWQSSSRLIQSGVVPATSMLLANYRSHSSLLNLPSKLFYRGQLVAAADPESVLPPQWKELRIDNADEGEVDEVEEDYGDGDAFENNNEEEETLVTTPSASLMFYGVRGQQVRESDVPSFHNPLEAAAVADLVQGLLDSVNAGVKLTDIGIMATYRRQVQSIRLLLRQRGLGQVRVGTVDDYQGQEERIVFISTVLTKPSSLPQHVSSDAQYLGLWNNPKRFNVAITRAKALLVVVGHPAVLIEDPSWKELLRHCASIGAFRGAGAGALAERLGVDLVEDGLNFINTLNGKDENNYQMEEEEKEKYGGVNTNASDEMAKAIDQMASLALLGVGDAAQMFPETLEEAYASYADEMEWRIML